MKRFKPIFLATSLLTLSVCWPCQVGEFCLTSNCHLPADDGTYVQIQKDYCCAPTQRQRWVHEHWYFGVALVHQDTYILQDAAGYCTGSEDPIVPCPQSSGGPS